MDARQERGLVIAATARLDKRGSGLWWVPSQSGNGRYTVDPRSERPTCDCPDFELRGQKCKHIYAVEYVGKREENPDGSTTVTETLTVSQTVDKRKTYPQNWTAYNAAQSEEKDRLQELLFDLLLDVPEPERTGRGRKP